MLQSNFHFCSREYPIFFALNAITYIPDFCQICGRSSQLIVFQTAPVEGCLVILDILCNRSGRRYGCVILEEYCIPPRSNAGAVGKGSTRVGIAKEDF